MYPHKKSIPRAISIAIITMALPAFSFAGFKQGDTLPDLASFHLEGKLPSDLKGQVILLDFWASWCGPCKSSFPAMESLRKTYADRGLSILAVSIDEKRENMDHFLKSANVSFAVVRDAKQKLVTAADIPAMPTSFLIDRTGQIRFIHAGFLGDETVSEYKKEIDQLLAEPKP